MIAEIGACRRLEMARLLAKPEVMVIGGDGACKYQSSLLEKEMRTINGRVLSIGFAVALACGAHADLFSIKLTSNALGLGTGEINKDNVINADIGDKLYTSGVTGQGSILNVQMNGLAGTIDRLATITARTHLDNSPFGDFQAGVIYIDKEDTHDPDGKDEGIGVRAFTINTTGLRTYDSGTGRAKIEGSKEVSGGTDPNTGAHNGAPHVDEDVTFTFDSGKHIGASSLAATVAKFESTDKIWLTLLTRQGNQYQHLIDPSMSGFFDSTSDSKTWIVKLSGFGSVIDGQTVDSFTMRAVDPDPTHPSSTAEHFLISGFRGETILTPVPEPLTLLFGGAALAAAYRRRIRKA